MRLSYTANDRATHDLWVTGSGRHSADHSGERTSVVAQSVNAWIASRARHFISPPASMWTWFVRAMMGRRVGDRLSDSGGEAYEESRPMARKAAFGRALKETMDLWYGHAGTTVVLLTELPDELPDDRLDKPEEFALADGSDSGWLGDGDDWLATSPSVAPAG